ncbi:DNA-3-methyladenine glycosylase [Pengzhenrongella sicca]|uniref:Putative 3-methyladenine DNA glycosylase n=1 Tax=Pengzhenrongella sicca TaxID=2819238 RepID=A0A8A4ZIA7_9MICO|nr:DNA-3-methyladenine glycosylase [Pengzhenrongella sicca]QTE30709.1 DNA-3-methyladenine glycosylase [Pengzhenrongella sicca]
MTAPLERAWFARDAPVVAGELLGASVTTTSAAGRVTVRITEVEAYRGDADPGSHAYRGPTARNAAMFAEPGRLYVYRHLGLHICVNIVCEPAGVAAAVLLRAGEVTEGAALARERRQRAGVLRSDVDLARGPARLAVALGIDLTAGGLDVTDPDGRVVVQARPAGAAPAGATGPRVGVSGVGGDGDLFPWRAWLPAEPTVSAYRAAVRRRGPEHGRLAPGRRFGAPPASEGELRE